MVSNSCFPERIIPDETPPGVLAQHLRRYGYARAHLEGKRVLDVACGVGYGSNYLADQTAYVVGVDRSAEAITYAQTRYGGSPNLIFIVGDALRLPLGSAQFDAVCSFETVEHLPEADMFLQEIIRVLKPAGTLFISTPCAKQSTNHPANPYHLREWDPADFEALLRQHFTDVEIFSQSRRQTTASRWIKQMDVLKLRTRFVPLGLTRRIAHFSGVRATPDLLLDDVFIEKGISKGSTEVIAVAHSAVDREKRA